MRPAASAGGAGGEASARATTRGRRVRRRSRWARRVPAPLARWLAGEFGPIGRALCYGPTLAILLLTLPALTLASQFAAPHRIDVGEGDDTFYLRGVLAQEQGGGTDFRWTTDRASVVLPAAPGNSAWTVALRLSGSRPPGAPAPPVSLLADGRLIARFDTVQPFQDYRFHFTRPAFPADDLTVTLETTTYDPPGATDDRQLGVQLDEVTLTPARRGPVPVLPPPGYAALVLALVAGGAGLLGRLGLDRRLLAGALLAGVGGILAGVALRPDPTALYLRGLFLVVVALFAALLALRPLVRRLFAAGAVPLTAREEQLLLGIFLFGAAVHLAGVFFPGFLAHDIGFQVNRQTEVLRGQLLLSAVSSEWGFRRTPYPPALYVLLAPFAGLSGDPALVLRLLPPIIDASSVFLIAYLLRRVGLPGPAPLLAAACYTLIPATYQLLWWGFFPNLFGQWATLAVLTLAVGHWGDLRRPWIFGALVAALCLALLSHPGTFALTLALIPLLALALGLADRAGRGSAATLLAAFGLGLLIVFALYYRHFALQLLDQVRAGLTGAGAANAEANEAPGWEINYIRLRVFALPFLLYFAAAWIAGVRLALARNRLGWMLLTILATASAFAAIHVTIGVWARYFVFVSPALAIGMGVALAWLWRRPRWGPAAAGAALAYCAAATGAFWFGVAVLGNRSPYP